MKYEELKLPNPGVLLAEIPSDIFETLKQEVDKQTVFKSSVQKKFQENNKNLVGQIEKEYKFNLPENFKTFLAEFYSEYNKHFDAFVGDKMNNINAWVNMQQKNEYNPSHTHDGDLSWVVWVKIPYSLVDEDNMSNTKQADFKFNSRFEFIYADLSGKIRSYKLEIDNTWEEKIILFPSYLRHIVYPFFTSDEYRISISGNILTTSNI
jgi:hypothetical protein